MVDPNLPKIFRYISYLFYPNHIWELESKNSKLAAQVENLTTALTTKYSEQEQKLLDECTSAKIELDDLKREYEALVLSSQVSHRREENIHRMYCHLHSQVDEFVRTVDLTWDGFRPNKCPIKPTPENKSCTFPTKS